MEVLSFSNVSYDNEKNGMSMRSHLDSGYESIFHSSFSSDSSSNSMIFSQPSTPVKASPSKFKFTGNNSTTSQDLKQQIVADIDGLYFASIRSPCKSVSSASCSPKMSRITDSFIHTKDNLASKLLRSPAFKIDYSLCSPSPQRACFTSCETRPSIRSFSSRLLDSKMHSTKPTEIKPTPTEQDFMQLLINNHHLPNNPEFLIGRRMGLDYVDIISELNRRSMNNVLDQIFSYMSVGDVVRMGCVSRDWRTVVNEEPKRQRERVKFIKFKRKILQDTKENRPSESVMSLLDEYENNNIVTIDTNKYSDISNAMMTHMIKNFKRSKFIEAVEHEMNESMTDHLNVLNLVDMNCLNSSYSSSPRFLNRVKVKII